MQLSKRFTNTRLSLRLRKMVTVATLIVPVGATLVGGTGCGAPPANVEEEAPPLDDAAIPASAASVAELGVTEWRLGAGHGERGITGYDAEGNKRIGIRIRLDGSGGGQIASAGADPAVIAGMTFSVREDGYVIENEFVERPQALRAITLAMGDLRAAPEASPSEPETSMIEGASLRPTTLTKDGQGWLSRPSCRTLIRGVGMSCNQLYRKSTTECGDLAASRCEHTLGSNVRQSCYDKPTSCSGCQRILGQCGANWVWYENLGCDQACPVDLP